MGTAKEKEGAAPGAPQLSAADLRVLVLAPTGRDAELAAGALRASGHAVAVCPTMDDLTRAFLEEGAGAALIALEALTPAALDALDRALARQPGWSDLPLVILTGGGRATEAGEVLLQSSDRLGNATFLERPLRIATLVRSVRVALRSRRRQYEIRGHLQERAKLVEQQRAFLRDILGSVTEGRLRLVDRPEELPARLPEWSGAIPLAGPALSRLRLETARAAQAAGIDEERADLLVTAVNEAGMNAVSHAGGGTASVHVDPERGTVQVRVEDRGKGIDMARLPRATLERGYSSAGTFGHGFWMMLETADRTYLLTGPTGTTVVIEQDREQPEPAWMRRVEALTARALQQRPPRT